MRAERADMALQETISQVSAVPFRVVDSRFEFCLITGRRSGRWGFPRGLVRNHDSIVSAVLAEAREEAGVDGAICGPQLGHYYYGKKGQSYEVSAWLLHVVDSAAEWKERKERSRAWVSLTEARRLIDRPYLHQLLADAAPRLGITLDPLAQIFSPTGVRWPQSLLNPDAHNEQVH